MDIRRLIALALIFAPTGPVQADRAPGLDAFIGSWDMDLAVDPATFGDRGGAGQGAMDCSWGPRRTWVECTLDSHYEGLGPYALKIVLFRDRDDAPGAFVTNSFGGGRLYTGHWQSDTVLVYQDAWVDPSRTWPHQRTTYRFHDNGQISFEIEVSADDQAYLPHSRGRYHPRR